MSEIKVLYCAHVGCIGSQNHAPGSLFMCSSLYKGIILFKKNMHTPGAQVLKSVHPAAKMCTQGAGAGTLNFENCNLGQHFENSNNERKTSHDPKK